MVSTGPLTTTSGKQDRVKVAIQPDKVHQPNTPPVLMDFEHSIPLTTILKDVCSRWHMDGADRYSFKYAEADKGGKGSSKFGYVTEDNRQELRNGDILCIALGAPFQAKATFDKVISPDLQSKLQGIKELAHLSRDSTFAVAFIAMNGVHTLMTMVEKAQPSSSTDKLDLANILAAFQELMEHGIVSWDTVGENFVKKIINFFDKTRQRDQGFSPQVGYRTLGVLESIVLNSTVFYDIVTKEVPPRSVVEFIEKTSEKESDKAFAADVIHYALALINAMISKAPDQQLILSNLAEAHFSHTIRDHILQASHGEVDRDIAHQLSVYQSYILNRADARMRQSFRDGDSSMETLLRSLPESAFQDEYMSKGRSAPIADAHWKQLGFSHSNPRLDFSESPPGILALDCMVYLAKNKHDIFTRLLFTRTDSPCPFAQTSVALTKVLCQMFRIGEQAAEIGYVTEFIPVMILSEEPFKEIFCITIQLLFKTWREMRASLLDLEKVMTVVMKQITTVIQAGDAGGLVSFDVLRNRLFELSYKKIIETDEKSHLLDESVLKSKPVQDLREKLKPEILNLIRQERLHHLVEGASFPKMSGRRGRDQNFYCRLAPNHKVLHFGDTAGQTCPALESLDKKIQVSEMRLEVGSSCPHATAVKKGAHGLIFSLFYNDDHLDFYAPTETVYNIWIDGLSVLLGKKMPSKAAEEDLSTLLNMDLKLQLLDLENVTIPNQQPPLPPEPSNFDFYYKLD